ncbi:hypothetical protein OUZ56_027892 [Daphnia magna]|uniref:Uncharacterized protein n=1 Tax=Daphnia magna TaxID=35525 RepID=A0ABR0B286_9CRUS|nr:hypothetical protein OUZ56_027892 [Daphnia magna]
MLNSRLALDGLPSLPLRPGRTIIERKKKKETKNSFNRESKAANRSRLPIKILEVLCCCFSLDAVAKDAIGIRAWHGVPRSAYDGNKEENITGKKEMFHATNGFCVVVKARDLLLSTLREGSTRALDLASSSHTKNWSIKKKKNSSPE